jgi:hypothetical protein
MDQLARSAPARVSRLALAVLLALGSLMMWIGIPAAWLWAWSMISDRYLTVLLAGLAGCPVVMIGWGWCLGRINRAYRGSDYALEMSMTISVLLAIAGFIAWIIFLGAPGNGAAPGAW